MAYSIAQLFELIDQPKSKDEFYHEYAGGFGINYYMNRITGFRPQDTIAIQEISKEYQRQKTNQCSPMDGSARKPQQYLVEAGEIT